MSAGGIIELGEFVLPGTTTAEGAQVVTAFSHELTRLWQADRARGIGWKADLGELVVDIAPGLSGGALAAALAREVQRRAQEWSEGI